MSNDLENVMQYAEVKKPRRASPQFPQAHCPGPARDAGTARASRRPAQPGRRDAALHPASPFAARGGPPLVMTSGNLTDEPLASRDGEAVARLGAIADGFLVHDREIGARTDDSVARVLAGRAFSAGRAAMCPPIAGQQRVARRSSPSGRTQERGLPDERAPRVPVPAHRRPEERGGAGLFHEVIEHLRRLFEIEPEVVAHDLHPDYLSTRHALALKGSPLVGVQHHHAHVAACLAEHRRGRPGHRPGARRHRLRHRRDDLGRRVPVADLAGFATRPPAPCRCPAATPPSPPWRSALAYCSTTPSMVSPTRRSTVSRSSPVFLIPVPH